MKGEGALQYHSQHRKGSSGVNLRVQTPSLLLFVLEAFPPQHPHPPSSGFLNFVSKLGGGGEGMEFHSITNFVIEAVRILLGKNLCIFARKTETFLIKNLQFNHFQLPDVKNPIYCRLTNIPLYGGNKTLDQALEFWVPGQGHTNCPLAFPLKVGPMIGHWTAATIATGCAMCLVFKTGKRHCWYPVPHTKSC